MEFTANNLIFKTFQGKIIDGISFHFVIGNKTAIYGPKNSGKKALLLIMGGYLKPSHGSFYFDKSNVYQNLKKYRQGNGLNEIMGINQLNEELTIRENILYSSKLYGQKINLDEIIERFELESFADTPIAEVGQLERALTALICGTINNPQRIFLNEPTSELTDQEIDKYWQLLNINFPENNFIFTTRSLVEAKRADNIIKLERGRLKND